MDGDSPWREADSPCYNSGQSRLKDKRRGEPYFASSVVSDMTAYVANHEKKQRIFEKRERELLHAIKQDHAAEKLTVAAERLRAAKFSVFKCRFSAHSPAQPHHFNAEEAATRNRQLERWLTMTTPEIIAMYQALLE